MTTSPRFRALRRLFGVLAVLGAAGCTKGEDSFAVHARQRPAGAAVSDAGDTDGAARRDDAGGGRLPDGAVAPGEGGAARVDGGPGADGGLYIRDGSVRLPDGSEVLTDGAIELPDGQVIDETTAVARYGDDVDIATCSMSEIDSWQTPVTFGDEGGFTLAAGGTGGFALAYQSRTTGDCTQNVAFAHLSSTGAFPNPGSALSDCAAVRDVSVFEQAERSYLAWVDNLTLTAELHVMELGPALEQPSGSERKTLTMSQPELEMKPVIGEVGGRPLLAWIALDADSGERGVMGKFLDDDDEPFVIAEKGTAQSPNGLAITGLGIDGNGAVAWVGPQQNPGVWLQPVDANGRALGSPQQLTERVGASSSVSLATRRDGGGVAYSIVIDDLPQVRFHRLDGEGRTVGAERSIIGPPLRAQDASIAGIGGGYALIYRALPGEGQLEPEIRMTFITREGNTLRDPAGRLLSSSIAPATISTGRTTVAVSIDGQIMIAWIDADPDGEALLKVVRRRLDCAE